jgi:coproporphyrinogen III oxidase
MNTRFLTTSKAWFGGGGDSTRRSPMRTTPPISTRASRRPATRTIRPITRASRPGPTIILPPHRKVHRGVGGIFYDHLECADEAAFEANFAFTRDVGEAFLDIYPRLVRRRMDSAFTPDEETTMLEWRGRYAEFNLVYDRGTLFGLKTGGNIDAILMSLPPARCGADGCGKRRAPRARIPCAGARRSGGGGHRARNARSARQPAAAGA